MDLVAVNYEQSNQINNNMEEISILANSNTNLDSKIADLKGSVIDNENHIVNIASINQEQSDQITKNIEDISNLANSEINVDSRIADLVDKVEQLSTCKSSAANDFSGYPINGGRFVGNCNSGNAFSTSNCRFECLDVGIGYKTCATIQCSGANKWTATSGNVCCQWGGNTPWGCC